MTKPIHILHYEDDSAYRASFKLIAQQQRILVDAVDNADELIELLESDHRKYQFVVLDARAYLHEGQSAGTESEANLHKIFSELSRIATDQRRPIPYCINTGFSEYTSKFAEVISCPVYEKGNEDDLIKYIWKEYNNTSIAKIKFMYPDVLDFPEQCFDHANWQALCHLLEGKSLRSTVVKDRVASLSQMRRLVEHVLDLIFEHHLGSPANVVKKKGGRAWNILYELKSGSAIPPHISGNLETILSTASNYGSHNPQNAEEMVDCPSRYTIEGLTFGFLDVLTWARRLPGFT